ncbi:unnamed protein product [Lymnaea stagnalis]|uniref:Uncharacterized protein n=1 Tax=Lymnaea stagnalis TaxID=6523 RepID=A0AAV2HG11_LYMST
MKASNTVMVICLLSITNSVLGSSTGATSNKAHEIPNSGHMFPVHIGAEGHIVQGRISADALPGTMIPSNVIVEGDNDADVRIHLRVEVRDSIYKRPHVYHPDIKINTSDPGNPQFEHPVIEFTNGTLPYGMEFVVIHTSAFYVNEDRYICVNDFSNLDGESRIHFDVILKDKLSETHYVSNQLPFVIEIEYPVREAHPNAALFAGVLVLIILAVSLLIPFVVRAKRRSKAGKPICGCGPAEESCDAESSGIIPGHEKQRVMSIGGKENLAMILDNGRLMHARPSVDQSTTIQNRMLRSTSSMVFQPHWMDPHYQDVYEHPDYHRMFYQGPGSPPDESPSSANSSYLYPPNFNLPVPLRHAHGDMMSVHAAAVAKVALAANGGHRAANGDLSAGKTGGAKGADAPGAAQGSDSNDNLRDEKF